jgi:hypothetical protein
MEKLLLTPEVAAEVLSVGTIQALPADVCRDTALGADRQISTSAHVGARRTGAAARRQA